MKKNLLKKKVLAMFVSIAMITSALMSFVVVFATENTNQAQGEPPTMPSGEMEQPPEKPNGAPGSTDSSNIEHVGATTISSDTITTETTYSSSTGSENALLVTGGTSTITDATVTKTGDASGDESDFYGTNAAVLVTDGTLNIDDTTITTDGGHANAVFAYGSGTININDSTINTSSNNSGAIMVTGGGTLTANDVIATTQGNSSAPIRSDRGGGTLIVNDGTYTSYGVGSPAVYSTANIVVNDATLVSNASEGIVVEGANSVTLNDVSVTDNNTTLNGNSETYKNIFLYQSMSGDADVGNASFVANDSSITTNNGDTIFVTNTTATIELENNNITNNSGDFLRIQSGKWGTSGANGGNVTLNLKNQKVNGDIIVDSISTLDLSLSKGSVYTGSINSENQAKGINLTLSSDSVISLTSDTYVTSLANESSNNSNIYLNGNKLYVNGTEVSANEGTYDGSQTITNNTEVETVQSIDSKVLVYAVVACIVVVLLGMALVAKRNK